jgi:hypothetical protein
VLILHTGPVTERLRVREIDDDEGRVGIWAKANNTEIAYTPTNSSWLTA